MLSLLPCAVLIIITSAEVRITHDEKGVSFFHDIFKPMNDSISRRLISGSASAECASAGGYSNDCISTNPTGCGCEALTTEEKQAILDLHNARRDMAAGGIEPCALSSGAAQTQCPAASDMNSLFWDPALEELSNFWAHQCIWDHHSTWDSQSGAGAFYLDWYNARQSVLDNTPADAMYLDQCDSGNCKAHGFTSGWIGENLAASYRGGRDYTIEDITDGINAWYEESADYVWSTGESVGGMVGHWTQGVWAKSRYIGCSYAICPGGASSPWGEGGADDWMNFVCKYYPGGNYNGADPYTTTPTPTKCSECESDRQGCISSATSEAAPQNALCGGPQCSACAVDYNQKSCDYGFASCPATVFTNDGTEGPAMNPTARPVSFTGEPTLSPTAPTTAQPTPDGSCAITVTGFDYSGFNGEYAWQGEHNDKNYYQLGGFYMALSSGFDAYIITASYDSNSAYCYCDLDSGNDITACTAGHWFCWGGSWVSNPSATVVSSCANPTPAPVTPAPVTAPPTTSLPTTSAPTTASPITASPTSAAPTTSSPTTSAPTTQSPTTSSPTTASPTSAAPTTSDPTTASPTTSAPTTADPTTAEPTTDSPTTSAPTTAAPTSKAPTSAAPTTSSPTTSSPTTSAPTTAEPTTSSPTTSAPTNSDPTTANPTTSSPTTSAPITAAPTTAAPTTESPTSSAPTTSAPTTSSPTTSAPTSTAPTTDSPTTPSPVTAAPTSSAPTSALTTTDSTTSSTSSTSSSTSSTSSTTTPTTSAPTTSSPTTSAPTTSAPTTSAPTTEAPTSAAPTTSAPTTSSPTTSAPTTAVPTTDSPTTGSPVTAAPTTSAPSTASPTTASPTGDASVDVDVSMELTISGFIRQFETDANSFTNGDINALATDLLRFAISDAVGVSIRIDAVSRSTERGFTIIEYTLTSSPMAINGAMQSIADAVDGGAVYQHTAGVSRQFAIVANSGATPFPTESQNGPNPTTPLTPAPVTATPAPVTATPSPVSATPAPVATISTVTMDLTIEGRKNQFEQEASEYAFGDSVAYAREIIEFGIEPAQNVMVEVIAVLRGSAKKTMMIEYTLSSESSAALNEAVSNIDEKASEGAVFQFYFGGSREWPFVSNEEASLALLNEGATDEGALDLLDEAESDTEGNGLWVIAVVAAVSVIVCGAVVALVYRKRRASKVVAFDHVAAEMTIVSEMAPVQGTTELVSEII